MSGAEVAWRGGHPESGFRVRQGAAVGDGGLVDLVLRELRASIYPRLRDLDVGIREGTVVLRGQVPTYHQKQMAQSIVRRVEGVREIINEVEVIG